MCFRIIEDVFVLFQDKRDLIVQELFSTEQQYVETLKMLVEVGYRVRPSSSRLFSLEKISANLLTLLLNLLLFKIFHIWARKECLQHNKSDVDI